MKSDPTGSSLKLGAEAFGERVELTAQGELRRLDRDIAGFVFGEVQDPVDDRAQMIEVLDDRLQAFLAFLLRRAFEQEELRDGPDESS